VIFDQPTPGGDVGAKVINHRFIYELADDGIAVVVISLYLPSARPKIALDQRARVQT
jgi:ABC-type sugar transport system ATPase subunit